MRVALAAGAGALVAAPAWGQGIGRWEHPMTPMGLGWLGTALIVIVAAAVVLVLLALAHRLAGGAAARRADPLDILKERLARGEIDVDEYERRRRALEP